MILKVVCKNEELAKTRSIITFGKINRNKSETVATEKVALITK